MLGPRCGSHEPVPSAAVTSIGTQSEHRSARAGTAAALAIGTAFLASAAFADQAQRFARLTVEDGLSQNTGRYEFREEGGGTCGNFMIVEATAINPEWIKVLPNGGGRSALARVRVNNEGPFTLKIYAYPDSPADVILQAIEAGGELPDHLHIHGMTTYDFFSILKAVQGPAPDFQWLSTSLAQWKEVKFPLALVAFGDIAVEEDPEE